MKVDNTVSQDMESLGKERFLNMARKSFGFFLEKILKYPKMDIT